MRFRFKKKDRVEVLSKREVPSGSWFYGTLLSGNGHTYYLKYENPSGTTGEIVERVPRKAIRPCPPVEVIESWEAGDFVEVFDGSSWKFASVLKATERNMFLVNLLGTSQRIEAHKSCLRIPQSWQDEEWVVIQTVPGYTESFNSDQKSTKRSYHKSLDKDSKRRSLKNDSFPADNEAGFQKSTMVSSKPSKRVSPYNLTRGPDQKSRARETEARLQQMVPENHIRTFIKDRDTRYAETDLERRNGNNDAMFSLTRSFDSNDAERSGCSVGSSGTSNKEEMVDATYELALGAYHRAMESLRALGYMSWEQEEMITDLRMKLNISNDQHLMELRRLVSAR